MSAIQIKEAAQISVPKENDPTSQNVADSDLERPITTKTSPQSSSGEETVADLETYIQDAYCYRSSKVRRPIFNQSPGHYIPRLKKNRINRVILYAGIFNPPHRAHQALLNCAFSCSQDINVIAAIVYPSSRVSPRKKYADEIVFSKLDRARLWLGDNGPHDWLWVYDRDGEHWDFFKNSLEELTAKDGFTLEFVFLSGPDNVGPNQLPNIEWDCKELIVCDIGRESDMVGIDGTLARCNSYGPWSQLDHLEEIHTQEDVEMPAWLLTSLSLTMAGEYPYAGPTEELRRVYNLRMDGIRVCVSTWNEEYSVRFIPAEGNTIHASSANIQYILKTSRLDELYGKISQLVLNPAILAQLVRDLRKSTAG
ncbi:hypothetical protein F5Y11DRAFT_279910 [Daldinia sp. FL1419]|nr:hypothetical protein F5Y11DRAFT_279910 [Daldinia sp. FL1419]